MTVAHKDLTGTDLHEIKGASTAASGEVPIADGAGTTAFGKLTHANLETTGNPFGAQLVHVIETQAGGVASTSSGATGSFVTTTLNTASTNEVTGASLASSTVTLPAGTYYCEIHVPWQAASTAVLQKFQARLMNLTTVAAVLYGQGLVFFGSNDNATLISSIRGRFTLAAPSVLSIQHYKSAGVIGTAAGVGTEIYTTALFWKVA